MMFTSKTDPQRMLLAGVFAVLCMTAPMEADEHCPVCATHGSQNLVSRHVAQLQPRRIVLVETKNREDRLREQTLFADSLAQRLREHGFEAVVSRDCICRNESPIYRGKFDERKVIGLAKRYSADTILYCDLEKIAAYDPMRMQSSVLLINAAEAVSLVSSTSTFDLADAGTKAHFMNFAVRCEPHVVPETLIHSPRVLIDFAATEIAADIASIWLPGAARRYDEVHAIEELPRGWWWCRHCRKPWRLPLPSIPRPW